MKKIITFLLCLYCVMATAWGQTIVADGTCGAPTLADVAWKLDSDSVLTFSGTGNIRNYLSDTTPWYSHKSKIKKVVIGEGILRIGSYAFYECPSLDVASMPTTLKFIGKYAFGYSSLPAIDLSMCDKFEVIDPLAFYRCASLTKVDWPTSLIEIDNNAFQYANLTKVDLSKCLNLKSIGIYAFDDNTSLKEMSLPDHLDILGAGVFRNTALTTVDLSNCTAVETIAPQLFFGCEIGRAHV